MYCRVFVLWLFVALPAAVGKPAASPVQDGLADELRQPDVVVCVADFLNLKPHPDWDYLGKAIAEGLSSRLSQELKSGKVVERARLQDLKNELNLAATDLVDPKTAAELGKMRGASHIIVGSYRIELFPERRTINIRLVEVETARVLWGDQFTGTGQAELEARMLAALLGQVDQFADPGDSYRKGLALVSEGKYAEALPLLWAGVEQAPRDISRHRLVEDCARQGKRGPELLKRYQALIRQHPSSAIVHNYLGNALLLVDPQDTTGLARKAYQRSLELDSAFSPPINNLAAIELNAGHPAAAMEGFRKYLEKTPDDAFGWINLGHAYLQVMRSKGAVTDAALQAQAEKAYRRALELDCGLASAWRGFGALYELIGRRDEAVTAYRGSLQLDPGQEELTAHLTFLQASAETKAGGANELPAGSAYTREWWQENGRERKYSRARIASGYGEALRLKAQGKINEAIDLCNWSLQADPSNALGWLLKAELCLQTNRRAEAVSALDRAGSLRPGIKESQAYKELDRRMKQR